MSTHDDTTVGSEDHHDRHTGYESKQTIIIVCVGVVVLVTAVAFLSLIAAVCACRKKRNRAKQSEPPEDNAPPDDSIHYIAHKSDLEAGGNVSHDPRLNYKVIDFPSESSGIIHPRKDPSVEYSEIKHSSANG